MATSLPILVYEDSARYDSSIKLLVGGVLALTLGFGFYFLFQDTFGAVAMFAITAFDALLFWAILPRKYQIFQDRLRLVLGEPFALNIPFSTIKEASATPIRRTRSRNAVRFATSAKTITEITRTGGWNVVISPCDRDMFLEQLHRALASYPSSAAGASPGGTLYKVPPGPFKL